MEKKKMPETVDAVHTHTHTSGILNKQNIILADCNKEEIELLVKGLEETLNQKFEIHSNTKCNGKRSFWFNIYRYLIYIFYPFKFFLNAKKYNYVICWQQFFGLFYAFYCNLFKIKKKNLLVIVNFTYKEKNGKLKNLYKKVMKFCIKNQYVDYIHVLSLEYAKKCAEEFNVPIEKFIVAPFGLNDTYEKYKDTKVEYGNYSLAIGRSNRDYDFLIKVWKKVPNSEKLLIACDEYNNKEKLPENIILRKDITFDLPYIANCKLVILPIKDGTICSGDTVLLKAMSYYKPVVVTEPSTLAEMYIKDKENGFCLPKEEETFAKGILNILNNRDNTEKVAQNARKSFEENYSRFSMGKRIGEKVKNENCNDRA